MNIKNLLMKYRGIILYLIFGALTTVINVTTYHLCYANLGISNVISTSLAWVVAVSFAFVTNKLFVFESKKKNKEAIGEAVSFFACRVGTGVIEVGMMWIFVDLLTFNGTIMKLITNFVIIVINYIASKFLVFGGRKNENK